METFLAWLLSRMTQLTVRLLTLVCAGLFGADAVSSPDGQTALSQGGQWLFTALLGLGVDLVIHSARYGQLKAWWQRYKAFTPAVALLIVLPFMGAGCAQNETNRAAQAMIAVQTHAKNALDLHNAGLTTPAQEATIRTLLHAEGDAVNAYYDAIQARDTAGLAAAKAALAAAGSALAAELAKYHLPTTPITLPPLPPATTQPGN